MSRLALPSLLLLLSCTTPRAASLHPTEVSEPSALKATRCGDVTAIWRGKTPDDSGPLAFFVESLSFRFADGAERPFKPTGNIEPPHASFEVFSPDCAHVALAQDSWGPYHLVPTAELPAYLAGKRAPQIVQAPKGTTAQLHTDPHWLSPTRFEFFASCCGGVEVFAVDVRAPEKPERVYFAAEAPKGIRRTASGFEPIR